MGMRVLWAPADAPSAGSHKHTCLSPKSPGILLLRLAKSRVTILLNSYSDPAVPAPATQTTKAAKSGNYH